MFTCRPISNVVIHYILLRVILNVFILTCWDLFCISFWMYSFLTYSHMLSYFECVPAYKYSYMLFISECMHYIWILIIISMYAFDTHHYIMFVFMYSFHTYHYMLLNFECIQSLHRLTCWHILNAFIPCIFLHAVSTMMHSFVTDSHLLLHYECIHPAHIVTSCVISNNTWCDNMCGMNTFQIT